MGAYRTKIDRLISAADGSITLNGSTSHAAIVVERMLSRAQERVSIMTRYLDPLVYSDPMTLRAAIEFLRGGKKIRVLVDQVEKDGERNEFGNLYAEGDIEVRQVPEPLRESIAINFSVMDNKGFRLEKDESGATAVVSFGNDEVTDRLLVLFDKVWAQSQSVDVRESIGQ